MKYKKYHAVGRIQNIKDQNRRKRHKIDTPAQPFNMI
jgi:hypothetical protein